MLRIAGPGAALALLAAPALAQPPVATAPDVQALQQAVVPTAPTAAVPVAQAPVDAQVRPDASDPVASMIGLSQAGVRDRLDAPNVARHEGAGGMWTYRLPTCALYVFFRDEPGQGWRVSAVEAGPLADGQPTPPTAACLASAPPAGGPE